VCWPSGSSGGGYAAGVKFTNNKNGTATIAGTPTLNAKKAHTITLKAANAAGTVTEKLALALAPHLKK
jgi:hypothetical protein